MKSIARSSIGAAFAVSAITFGLAAGAAADEPKLSDLIRLIEKQQQQINAMKTQLEATQGKAEQAASVAEAAAKTSSFLDKVSIGGVAEVEMTNSKDFNKTDTSDITLAKVEFFVDTKPHEYLSTHVQMLYEDSGSENITLDEAFAILGNTDKYPLYLQAGKWAMPFGNFDTAMSTDPLTKSMGEIKEAAILLGAEKTGLSLQGFLYNGDTQKAAQGNKIDQYGAALGYGAETNGVAYNTGIGYLNNFADSGGLTTGLGTKATAIGSYVSGIDLHGDVTFSGITLRGGYMKALKSFRSTELAFNGKGAQPVAWNLEASYTLPLMGKDTTFAATLQGTDEALALNLPEKRYGGAVSVAIVDHFTITGEYLLDEDYAVSKGGTGNSGHTATLKLAAEY